MEFTKNKSYPNLDPYDSEETESYESESHENNLEMENVPSKHPTKKRKLNPPKIIFPPKHIEGVSFPSTEIFPPTIPRQLFPPPPSEIFPPPICVHSKNVKINFIDGNDKILNDDEKLNKLIIKDLLGKLID